MESGNPAQHKGKFMLYEEFTAEFEKIKSSLEIIQSGIKCTQKISESEFFSEYLRCILIQLFNDARDNIESELKLNSTGAFKQYRDMDKRSSAVQYFMDHSQKIQSLLLFHLNFIHPEQFKVSGAKISITR